MENKISHHAKQCFRYSLLSKTQCLRNKAMKKQLCAWDGWILARMASKLGLEDEVTLSACRHGEVIADREPGTHGEKSGNECFSWQKDGQEMGRNLRGPRVPH